MDAADPATGAAHTFDELRDGPLYVVLPGRGILDGYRPANPLVACQRGDILPRRKGLGFGDERFPQVGW